MVWYGIVFHSSPYFLIRIDIDTPNVNRTAAAPLLGTFENGLQYMYGNGRHYWVQNTGEAGQAGQGRKLTLR